MTLVAISLLFSVTVLCGSAVASPQRSRQQPNQDDLDKTIRDVFMVEPPRLGPGAVVTPEPNFIPTTGPQTLIDDGEQCTCVPYHMCDPKTNTTRGEPLPSGSADQGTTDVFHLIDIRFNPDDCQDVLDVCCRDPNRKEASIPQPPITNKPNRASGCGIRNVGGIDFQLVGATVSVFGHHIHKDIKFGRLLASIEY